MQLLIIVLIAGGAILLYAAVKGVNPVEVIKNALQGKETK